MTLFGTVLRRAGLALAVVALSLGGCSGDGDDSGGSAGTTAGQGGRDGGAGSGGTGGAGSGGDTAGSGGGGSNCDVRGCWVTEQDFQAQALNCPDDYDAATDELEHEPGKECTSAFFTCGGLDGAAYQYGFTGDNVQCYYDDEGALVGGYRSSDHGAGTLFGEVPEPRCYTGPSCGDAGAPDGGAGTDEQRACEVSSDCVLAPSLCCPCGELMPDEVTAVHKDHERAFFAELCPPPVACPAIACATPVARYVASCVEGRCEAIDLRDDPSTACAQESDCRVRATACCECGAGTSPGQLAAVANEQAFESLVCDPEQGCPECEAMYPDGVVARCEPTGHCQLMDPREQF